MRAANPAIRHRTWQIAIDGSQKLPQRILGTLSENHAAGRARPGLNLAVAAWMRCVGGTDEQGQPIDVKDPLATKMRTHSDFAETPADKVAALLSVTEVFEARLAETMAADVTSAYQALVISGARAAASQIADR